MMKKVVGAFERVSDASGAVRAIRSAGFLASDAELVVRRRNAAWSAGNPLVASLADEGSDSCHRCPDAALRRP
jgi:hypothetical protein